jgi:hypothetical protein
MLFGTYLPMMTLSVSISVLLMAFTQETLAASDADNLPETSVHLVGRYGFVLDNREDNCILHSKAGDQEVSIPLDMNSPCYWIRSKSDEIIDYAYPEAGIDHTLLIAGTTLDWDDEKKQYQKLPTDQYCTARLQGLLISNNGINTSASSIEAPNCVGQAIDEKVFYGIAHDKDVQSQLVPDKSPTESSLFDTITQTLKGLFSSETEEK